MFVESSVLLVVAGVCVFIWGISIGLMIGTTIALTQS